MLAEIRESHERQLAGLKRLDQRLTFKFSIAQRLLDRQIGRILAPFGLAVTAYRALAIVDAFGEMSAADLVRMSHLDKALVSRFCQDLVASGLLRSRRDPASARRKLLSLTDQGQAKLAALQPVIAARNANLHALFTERELASLHEMLDRIIAQGSGAVGSGP